MAGQPPRVLQLEDEVKEAKTVVGEIAARIQEHKRQPRDFAVLCRTNEQPRAFEMEFRRLNIPYVLLGGMSFYDRKEVRDLLAYFKVLVNPRDEVSLLRIINTPARGIGTQTVKHLMEQAIDRGKPLWEMLPDAGLPAVEKFRGMIGSFRQRLDKGPWPRPSARSSPRSATATNWRGFTRTPTSSSPAGRPSKRWSTRWPATPNGRGSRRCPASCRRSP